MSKVLKGVKISRAEYDALDAVRSTQLKLAAKSLFHFHQQQKGNRRVSPAQQKGWDLGTLSHSVNLENDTSTIKIFDVRKEDGSEYSSPRASKSFKEMVAAHPDHYVITKEEYTDLINRKNAFWNTDDVVDVMRGCQVEVAFCAQDPITGLWLKCLVDFVNLEERRFGDLKGVPDASEYGVGRFAAKAKWPIQVGHYAYVIQLATGIPMEKFNFLAQEYKEPFYTEAHELAPFDYERCAEDYRKLLNRMAVAIKDNEWPGYVKRGALVLPPWAYEYEEIEENETSWEVA